MKILKTMFSPVKSARKHMDKWKKTHPAKKEKGKKTHLTKKEKGKMTQLEKKVKDQHDVDAHVMESWDLKQSVHLG